MKSLIGRITALLVVISLGSPVARAQEEAAPATIWSFLGIPQGVRKVHGHLFNRRGNLPGLEKKPPMLALADPKNLKSDVPAIKKAAEIKKAEDLKKQKIKAIKYLATIGCGCYDADGSVTEAMLAASEDCTEEVRLTTIESIEEAANGKCCNNCGQTCCCNEKILKQLAKIAYERNDKGCFVEPSARVREAAKKALHTCCPNEEPVTEIVEEAVEKPEPEREGVVDEEAPEGTTEEDAPADEADEPADEEAPAEPAPQQSAQVEAAAQWLLNHQTRAAHYGATQTEESLAEEVATGEAAGLALGADAHTPAPIAEVATSNVTERIEGTLMKFDPARRIAHVHLADHTAQVPVGTTMYVFEPTPRGPRVLGRVQVYKSFTGSVNVREVDPGILASVERGAAVMADCVAKHIVESGTIVASLPADATPVAATETVDIGVTVQAIEPPTSEGVAVVPAASTTTRPDQTPVARRPEVRPVSRRNMLFNVVR